VVDAPGAARVSSAGMPANRIVPLVDREALGGEHYLLTFRHPEAAREALQFIFLETVDDAIQAALGQRGARRAGSEFKLV